MNRLKGDLSNDTIVNPPLISFVNTFKEEFRLYFLYQIPERLIQLLFGKALQKSSCIFILCGFFSRVYTVSELDVTGERTLMSSMKEKRKKACFENPLKGVPLLLPTNNNYFCK